MNEEAPTPTRPDLPACPEWKTPKHLADKQEFEKVRTMTVEEALPSSVHRLAWLKDRDTQLRDLLNCLQSFGIPMGSETWALRALLLIRRLEAEREAARRVLRALNDKELPDLERMRLDFEHARAMQTKHLPPMETRCDWCGWPGARLIGGGNAACEDCLPPNE